ncbi:MAG: ABC transporter permease [Bacteroidales bacterium]
MNQKLFILVKLIRESYIFAFQAIIVNKLRTVLTLLGITIGIFSIISVFTVFDSLENKIKTSIDSLGDNVLFVQKWPWAFGSDYPWWKYMSRPVAKINELAEIENRSEAYSAATFVVGNTKTVKYKNNSISNARIMAVSKDYDKVMSISIAEGRYFTVSESVGGRPVAIIGKDIAENLFYSANPLGKDITVFGRKATVVGIFQKEGDDTFGQSSDNQVMLPINFARNVMDITDESNDPSIIVRAKPNVSNEELKDELTGIMRSVRQLKPSAEDNFAINEMSMITKGFESIFSTIGIIGWIIGAFSLIVGGFGIANIMFVSVKERTGIIGIQKSLGAKNYFILLQFLFEAVFLSLIGGALGLFIIFIGTLIVTYALDFSLTMTLGNIVLGLSVSFIIGLIAGFLPAFRASRLNPVDAIRATS